MTSHVRCTAPWSRAPWRPPAAHPAAGVDRPVDAGGRGTTLAVCGRLGDWHRRGQPRASHAAQRPLAGPQRSPRHPHRGRLLGVRLGVHRPTHPRIPGPAAPADGQCGHRRAELCDGLAGRVDGPPPRRWPGRPVPVALVVPTTREGAGQARRRPTARAIHVPAAPPGPRGGRRRHHPRPTRCWHAEPKRCFSGRSRCGRPKLEELKGITGGFTAPPAHPCPAASCASAAGPRPPDTTPPFSWSSRATSKTASTTGHG